MIEVRLAAVLLSLLLASPALAREAGQRSPDSPRGPYATLDLSLGLGTGNSTGETEPQLGFGLHLTARPGPIVLAGNMEGATNFFGSGHAFFTGGAGFWLPMPAGRLVLLGQYGLHAFGVVDFADTAQEHRLRIAGARAVWELEAGTWIRGRASLAASCYVDLEREHDADVGGDVGGVTLLLSFALGLGG